MTIVTKNLFLKRLCLFEKLCLFSMLKKRFEESLKVFWSITGRILYFLNSKANRLIVFII